MTCELVEVDRDGWVEAVAQHSEQGFDFLDMLTAAQEPSGTGVLVYAHLVRLPSPDAPVARALLVTQVPHGQPLPSVTAIHAGAAWHEREVSELFGVPIEGASDTRPLLGQGVSTPLRKDHYLAARTSTPWPGHEEGSRKQPFGVPRGVS